LYVYKNILYSEKIKKLRIKKNPVYIIRNKTYINEYLLV